jgi:hypothetical protein
MLIKIITNTLLSVFMDKEAREALSLYKNNSLTNQGLGAESGTLRNSLQSKSPTNKKVDKNISNRIDDISDVETRHLIAESLEAAKLEINAKHKITKNRKALIERALKLQQSKEYILNKLSEDQRKKLKTLALKILNVDAIPFEPSENKIHKKKK